MNVIIRIIIATFVIIFAGLGWECDNIVIRFVLFLIACKGMDVYHEYSKKIENENK